MQLNFHTIYFSILLFMSSWVPLAAQSGFDAERAFDDLQAQCDLGPRNPNSEGAQAAIQLYTSILKPLADTLHLQDFQLADPYSSEMLNLTNIVARFQPQITQRIILCAHWDTRPRAEYDLSEPEKPMIGANDGASGVAILLEIARQLQANPVNPGIDIILFDGEDYGEPRDLQHYLLGSRYYVDHPYLPMAQRVILLDMVGDAELTIKVDPVSYRSAPRLVEEIWALANDIGYDQFQLVAGASMYDDHVPFIEKGIQAIDIIDFEYPGPNNAYWHTHDDSPDKCSAESLEAVGNTLLSWLYQQ
ncbi:MAG: M28 family peptidase [Candidatus Marinimicrobia bacterium]|nr:M28 family peptidase [Candidatus Neomarinimicrobiota bacterium]MBT4946294.1 M28 family peptidase [Candidatus Neomarinimicrobiota bacterium]MBT5271065.1 M28 family peptidase [Candidatus Neomarinimicrobiota bacterium]MBT6009979.1 M28 family peptidase [Candidatus Neomarinimicrobiota bacterium]